MGEVKSGHVVVTTAPTPVNQTQAEVTGKNSCQLLHKTVVCGKETVTVLLQILHNFVYLYCYQRVV